MSDVGVCQRESCPFQQGLHWHKYQYLEEKIQEIARYLTIDERNAKAWGEEIADLLVLTGNAIDTFFKDMVSCTNIENYLIKIGKNQKERRKLDIKFYHDVFEPYYELSKNEVIAKFGLGDSQTLTSFKSFNNIKKNDKNRLYIPSWWDAYNDTKHQFYDKMDNANLGNTLNTIAGLFLRNSLHLCSKIYLARNDLFISDWPKDSGYKYDISSTRIGVSRWATPLHIITPVFQMTLREDLTLQHYIDTNI